MTAVNDGTPRPEGRDAVMRSILDAASQLFASEDPAATSIRKVAREAGVNHALVHRYFGTRDQLLVGVLMEEAVKFSSVVAGAPNVSEAADALFCKILEDPAFVTLLARTVLSGAPAGRRSFQEGAIHGLVERIRAEPVADRRYGALEEFMAGLPCDPRIGTAAYASLLLGWVLFKPFLTSTLVFESGDETSMEDFLRSIARVLIDSGRATASD